MIGHFRSRKTCVYPFVHRCGARVLSLVLWISVGAFFCAADGPSEHHLIFQLQEPSCADTLTASPPYQDGRLDVLRKRYAPHYRVDDPSTTKDALEAELQELWDQAYAYWRAADFERALEVSSPAFDAVLSYNTRDLDPTLHALMQLRITLWLLLSDDASAARESDRLLSRGPAQYHCSDTEFPEACTYLQTIEESAPIFWEVSEDALANLWRFSEDEGRILSVVSTDEASIRLTHVDQGGLGRSITQESSCLSDGFWKDTFVQWDAHLSMRSALLLPPPPRQARALERTLRVGVPIAAGVVGALAIASTIHLHRQDRALDRCSGLPDVCPSLAQIQDAYTRWRRARGLAVASWSTAGVIALSPIPLVLFKNRALRRAESARLEEASR